MNHKHGMHGTPQYESWKRMKRRTHGHGASSYENIQNDENWNSFIGFWTQMETDQFGVTFKPGMCLGRIDHEGDYTYDNCRWEANAMIGSMELGTRLAIKMPDGRIAKDVAEENGINWNTAWQRMTKLGWEIERAVTQHTKKVVT